LIYPCQQGSFGFTPEISQFVAECPDCEIIRKEFNILDANWHRNTVQDVQRDLLKSYNVVVNTDSDEFLFAECGLQIIINDFISTKKHALRATAYQIIHQIDSEPTLTFAQNERILEFRGSAWRVQDYDKTLITKVPLKYCRGFHATVGNAMNEHSYDNRLKLLHLQQVDLEQFYSSYVQRIKSEHFVIDAFGIKGNENKKVVEDAFRTNNRSSIGIGHVLSERIDIPTSWKMI